LPGSNPSPLVAPRSKKRDPTLGAFGGLAGGATPATYFPQPIKQILAGYGRSNNGDDYDVARRCIGYALAIGFICPAAAVTPMMC
jgi:hypothetical protein